MADSRKAADATAEVQDAFDEAMRKGYFGTVPDGPDNKAFSLESGPESPSALESNVAHMENNVKAVHASTAKGGK